MHKQIIRAAITTVSLFASLAFPAFANSRLVDMVPNNRSGETNQDAEPTISIDPNDFANIVGSAFTWDNLTGDPMATATAPVYVSTDHGNTWTLAYIVPSDVGAAFPTGDITLGFSSTLSGIKAHQTSWLYAGILRSPIFSMTVLRTQDPLASTLMDILDVRTGSVDQPHTDSETSGTGKDNVYVGFNNGANCSAPAGRSSTLDVSQDAAAPAPVFTPYVIETRDSDCQDGFAQVPAAHSDGTVYAAFIHDWSGAPRIVVVRDDHWGQGANPFTALTDSSDKHPGRYVTPGLTLPEGYMGQNRLGASNLSIAVDPTNSSRVYIAWGDANGDNSETIHVRRSVDRGVDWSPDLITVHNALNPEIAINNVGVVGLLYQSLVAGNWETRLLMTNNFDASTFESAGLLFASQDASTPTVKADPYIGDYSSLVAAGVNFYGAFSASNYPDKAHFLNGVRFQREVDWPNHILYADATHTTTVAPSIDPFYFEADASICNKWSSCSLCFQTPSSCYPIAYDPSWRFKCPSCGIQILANVGKEVMGITVFDSLGKQVGILQPLSAPVVENGVQYLYGLNLTPSENVGYVLRFEIANGKSLADNFMPIYAVKRVENGAQTQ